MDAAVSKLRADVGLKTAAAQLKAKVLCSTEALLHGDLHTGQVCHNMTTSMMPAKFSRSVSRQIE